MPNFPPISTLNQKPTLTGDEVIQISATEKTTLAELFNQLGFNLQHLLTGLDGTLTPGIGIPTEEDTLISALSKLIARAGGVKLFIMPTFSDTFVNPDEGYAAELRVILLADTADESLGVAGCAARLAFREREIVLSIAPYDEPIQDTYSTVEEIDNYIGSNTLYIWKYTCDREKDNSTTRISFDPGDVIFHTGDSITNIIIDMYYWFLNTSGTFSQYTATILTQVNVTKSMFNEASGGSMSNVTYLFMDGFDDNPGTTYQCITIQRVKVTGSMVTLLVNKCGYNEA